MSRELTTAVATAGAKAVVRIMDLAEFEFDTGTVRVTGAPYDVWFDLDGDGVAEEWKTLLGQGQVQGLEEGVELQSYGVNCSLSGIPPEVIALTLQETPQGRPARIWRCLLDEDHNVIPDPILIFAGRMDTMPIELGPTAELKLAIESRLADWDRVRGGRYTDAEQQRRAPGDRFFQFTAPAADKELTWGKA